MSVFDELGQSHTLVSLWERRKLVLVFTRHMGCRFCREQVSELRKVQPVLSKNGISVGVITVGNYKDIPRFKEENMFTGEVYVDTNLFAPECYKLMKLANGMEYLFASDHSKEEKEFLPETQEAAVRAASKGFKDGGFGTPDSEFTGDTLQIGGVFVLGPGNSCDYSYRCAYVGDLVDLEKVVVAATGRDAEGEEIFYARTLDWNDKLNINEVAQALPQGPVRKIVQELRSNGNMQMLGYHAAAGLAAFVLVSTALLVLSGQSGSVDVESSLTAAGVLIGSYIVGSYYVRASAAAKAVPESSAATPPRRRASIQKDGGTTPDSQVSGKCPVVAGTRSSAGGELTIAGCALLPLSAVDRTVLASAGDLDCDCTFLDEVDMINMTDRYTISAPVAVNSGLFAKLHGSSAGSGRTSEEGRTSGEADRPLSPMGSPQRTHHHHHATGTGANSGGTGCPMSSSTSTRPVDIVCDPALSGEHLQAAQSIICYVREFLAKPNPNLGRKGPTCPFVPKSLQLDSIYLSVLGQEEAGCAEDLEALLLEAIKTFKELEPRSGPKASYKAIILVFPDMDPADVPALIDGTQKKLKPNFVEEGLMLGEFHLRNNATGLHNDHFYPLRTPYPCLAIRHMVPSDIVFLNPAEFPPELRVRMISTFLSKFGDKAANDSQTEVARTLLKELQAAQ